MSLPTIQPQVFYGLTNDIKGNASYISENEILYPAGGVLILHNYMQKLQRYIKIPEKQKPINIICVSPSRKVAAVAERGERPCISIYELSTLKKKKVLGQFIETAAQEYVSLSFSFDGKFLAAILGDPDWTMVYFRWEEGKIDSTVKANNLGRATLVACNPTDNSVLAIVGPQLFRLLSASDKTWRQYGWSKANALNITSVAWLSFDCVIGGTSDGNLLLVDSGKLKAVYKATDLTTINMKLQEPGKGPVLVSAISLVQSTDQAPHPQMAVRALTNFRKGFAFACGSGTVHLFERETNDKYTKRNMFLIPEPEFQTTDMEDLNIVQSLSISPEENQLLATTMRPQMFSVRLWDLNMTQAHEIPFKMVGEQLHHGPVVGLSVCAWKPLFMTCGQLDRTVRVWNYETEMQELVKQYQDEIFSVAMHPTGLYTMIGFSDKLQFMVLTLDDIHPCREFPVRGCRECCFSNNGHLFAAVNGNTIQVYSSVSFENLYNLKGHNGKVKSLVWTHRDLKLVSCGAEGALYDWDIPSGTRVGEIITKGCIFNSVVATTDGKTSFGTDGDGRITEVSESMIVQAVTVPGQQLDCIVLSHSNQMMFITTQNGSVLSVQYPLQEPVQYMEYHMHNHPVTRMCMSYDDLTLITCSIDGSICIWKLTHIEGKTVMMDSEFKPSTNVLISKADLLEKIQMIKDLSLRMHELEAEHKYSTHNSEMMHAHKIKEMHENYCQAIKELKQNNEQLDSDHTTGLNSINDDISRMKTEHEQATLTLEANFTEKLIVEYNKYQALEACSNKMREEYERKLLEILHQREDDLSSAVQMYETQLQERNMLIEELRIQGGHQKQEHEAIMHQIEDDADREIVELKIGYEKQLHEERETNLCLRGETGIMKKKFSSSQKEIQKFKHEVYTLQQEQKRFQQTIIGLQRDISYLKEETDDRDRIIQDKEKQIYDLKRKNQELEKFKFVLNYKIMELKNQTEPKDTEIKDKKKQIRGMEAELENLQKTNTSLEVQLAELQGRLKSKSNELMSEHEKNREADTLLRRIRFDLHSASGLLQEPKKLKDTVKHLYHKYSQDSDFIRSQERDIVVPTEFMRQREHLKRTMVSIKRQVHKDTSAKQDNVSKIIGENTTLIAEMNNLRQQLKDAHKHISDMESILGISRKYMSPNEAQAHLQMAVQSHEEILNEYKSKLEERERTNAMLKEEMARLVHKLTKEEQGANNQKIKTSNFSA